MIRKHIGRAVVVPDLQGIANPSRGRPGAAEQQTTDS